MWVYFFPVLKIRQILEYWICQFYGTQYFFGKVKKTKIRTMKIKQIKSFKNKTSLQKSRLLNKCSGWACQGILSTLYNWVLYIWTSVWVLRTPNAGRNNHFQHFCCINLKKARNLRCRWTQEMGQTFLLYDLGIYEITCTIAHRIDYKSKTKRPIIKKIK